MYFSSILEIVRPEATDDFKGSAESQGLTPFSGGDKISSESAHQKGDDGCLI